MVLYKLKGITFKEVHDLLDGRSDEFNYITTKEEESYFIHAQHDADRFYRGQVEVFEVGDTLLCELTFEDELWWKNKFKVSMIVFIITIVSSFLTGIFFRLFADNGEYLLFTWGFIAAIMASLSMLYYIYRNARNPYLSSKAKRKIQLAFEDWFDDYL